jgi:hypothetical protein
LILPPRMVTPYTTALLVQVAFYALLLRSLIDEEQINDLEIASEGGNKAPRELVCVCVCMCMCACVACTSKPLTVPPTNLQASG